MNLRGSTVGASRILLLLICAGWVTPVCLGAQAASDPPLHPVGEFLPLDFAPRVTDNLALLYARFSPDEFLVCLLGERAGPVFRVVDFAMPPQERIVLPTMIGGKQRALKIDRDACVGYDAIGTLHSHPPSDRDEFCYASRQDTVTFSHRTHDDYIAIMCARGLFYWHRSQVSPGEPAYPVEGQRVPVSEKW